MFSKVTRTSTQVSGNGNVVTVFRCGMLLVFTTISFPKSASAHGAYHDLLEQINYELADRPDDPAGLFRRAGIHLGHHEWMLALLDLKKVETLAPRKFPVRWLKGQALHQGGKLEPARAEFDAFILANPRHAGALASRGRVLRELGQNTGALSDFRTALKIEPDADPELLVEIADTMVACGAAGEAALLLDSSLIRLGDHTPVLLKALEIDLLTKRWDSAIQRVDALSKSAPRPEPWLAKRAKILTQAGREAESRAAWTTLRDRIAALPNLERGLPEPARLSAEAERHLAGSTTP